MAVEGEKMNRYGLLGLLTLVLLLSVSKATPAGTTRTVRTSGIGNPLYGVAYVNSTFVAVGGGSNVFFTSIILTSP
jgi:hypothetical protein